VKTSLKQPATAIRASGGSGYNPYLLLVQRQISAAWVPPQVDPATQSFQVVIKFRLFRNGSVKELMIEQTSGNEYYDLAGKRAILSARLPEFPQSMPDLYLDAHFSFTVGQQFG
jgi:colicin import membrane protein